MIYDRLVEGDVEVRAVWHARRGRGPMLRSDETARNQSIERVTIRVRVDDDLDDCARLLRDVHDADAYPSLWPKDPRKWLSPTGMVTAWVAERANAIVGHIALRAANAESRAEVWSNATGLPVARLCAITRLFVSSENRRTGVGGELLDVACRESTARGLHPVLSVVETNRAAIHLYQQRGWRLVLSEPWTSGTLGELLGYYVR